MTSETALRELILKLADRVAGQSALLSRAAEKREVAVFVILTVDRTGLEGVFNPDHAISFGPAMIRDAGQDESRPVPGKFDLKLMPDGKYVTVRFDGTLDQLVDVFRGRTPRPTGGSNPAVPVPPMSPRPMPG